MIYIHGTNAKDESIASGKPCMMCERLILNAGISKAYVSTADGGIECIDYDKIREGN